jgi:hypothetical protein
LEQGEKGFLGRVLEIYDNHIWVSNDQADCSQVFFSFQNLDFFIQKLIALLSVNLFLLYVCVYGELCKTFNLLLVDAEVISV